MRVHHVACVIAALGPISVSAQRPDSTHADSGARIIAPVVVSGAREPAAVGGTAATIVRPDSLDLPPAPALADVLRATPFVLVRQNSRGEAELSIRGSDSRQAAVLLDGHPLTLGWDHRTDPSLVPLTGARRIAIVRGLSTLLAGPNVLGGVVEVDIAGSAAAAVGDRGRFAADAGIDQYGARSASLVAATGTSVGAGMLGVTGGASARSRDGVAWAGAGTDPLQRDGGALRANTDRAQVDGFASARLESRSGAHAGLTITGYRARRGVAPELHVTEPRLWRYPDVTRGLAVASGGTGLLSTGAGYARLSATVGASAGRTLIESFATPAYANVVGTERGDERTNTARVRATHSLPRSGELRVAVTAADVRYDERIDDSAAPAVYRQVLVSAGLEADVAAAGDARISFGVVADRASTPGTGGRAAQPAMSRPGWRLGLHLPSRSDGLAAHASLSRRSRFPALRELYSGALDRFEPNPDLRPETLTGFESGFTMTPSSRASVQAVAFVHRLHDAVVRSTTDDGRFRRINRDAIASTGLEVMAEWASAAPADRAITLAGDFMVQRVRVRDVDAGASTRPENQPELRGNAIVGMPLWRAARLDAGLHHTGRQFCEHPDVGGQVSLRGSTWADLVVTRAWSLGTGILSRLTGVVAVDNATDAVRWDQCGLPAPGRTLRVGVSLR